MVYNRYQKSPSRGTLHNIARNETFAGWRGDATDSYYFVRNRLTFCSRRQTKNTSTRADDFANNIVIRRRFGRFDIRENGDENLTASGGVVVDYTSYSHELRRIRGRVKLFVRRDVCARHGRPPPRHSFRRRRRRRAKFPRNIRW